jgi:hypothetical protein
MKQMPLITVAVAGLSLCCARKLLSNYGVQCSDVHRLRVKELRSHLAKNNVECIGCVEKGDFTSKAMGLCDAPEEVHLSEQPLLNDASLAGQQSWMAITVLAIGITPLLLGLFFTLMRDGRTKPVKHSENHEAIASDASCRICLSDECEPGDELFQPCRCTGTMQYVHKSCLNKWRLNGDNPHSYYECPQCHYQYNLRRLPLADFVASPALSKRIAQFSVILCIWPFACLAQLLFGHLFYTKLVWLQSAFVGFLMFGLLVHIAYGSFVIGWQNTLWLSVGAPFHALFRGFCDQEYIVAPGTVVTVLFECAIILAKVGLQVSVNLVFAAVYSVTRALMRKMETAILGQVLAFYETSKREPMNTFEHMGRQNVYDEDDDDEEEEEQ